MIQDKKKASLQKQSVCDETSFCVYIYILNLTINLHYVWKFDMSWMRVLCFLFLFFYF